MVEMVRLEVDAVPEKSVPDTESAVVLAYGSCEATVDEEKSAPPWSQSEVEVAAVEVPKVVPMVNG